MYMILKKSYKRIIAHARPRLQTKRSCAVLQPRTANATTLKSIYNLSPFSLSHLFTFQKPEGELLGKQAVYAQGVHCGWSEPLTCGLSIRTRSLVLCRNTRTRTRTRTNGRSLYTYIDLMQSPGPFQQATSVLPAIILGVR